ncbi:MAG: xanthine dehydrogenase family protein molybdopterin-binding subunit [Phyllobacteriaceae bacterium]|nr:xanthine dehydrogenase family protein molybdopterin-binding subunit [Phyllobacteriaceae bacterium]
MTVATPKFGMGASVRRLEDDAFITGRGRYTDDIAAPLHAVVLRSPIAAGRFSIGSLDAARSAPGVALILVGADVAHLPALKSGVMQKQPDGSRAPTRDIPILCRDEVRHVGDAVAFVVAATRLQAEDAAGMIDVDWEPVETVVDTARALDRDAALVWPELGSNRAFHYELGDRAKVDRAFREAASIAHVGIVNNRLVSNYMETRSAIGSVENGRLTLTTGSQGVHGMRSILAPIFGLKKEELRVVTPDVGGGFGPKSFVYREHVLVLEAASRLGRPVKWTATRTEHFLVDAHGRDNVVEAEMAMDAKGRFLALRIELTANIGAYVSQFGPFIPWMGATMSTGVYDIPALSVAVDGVYTHTCPVDAYRGAGRPEAAYLIERLVEQCGRVAGVSPAEIRRRNFIAPTAFPYRTPTGRNYDVGEFDGHMTRAMDVSDWAGFPARAEAAQARGKIAGIGMATYIEACAFAGSEPAKLTLEADGGLTLDIGTQSNGQGHATAYAQFVAGALNCDASRIVLRQGDSDALPKGGGTGGSRSIPLGGVSAARAGEDMARKLRRLAADELEASPEDIELVDGAALIVGTDRRIDYAAIARAAKSAEDRTAFGEFVQDEATYPNGTHIVEVEIDPETGATTIVRYTIVDDFGATVNPLLLAGQVHGGAAQGIGQALMENAVYGDDGQMIAATFMDYAMPRADDLPHFHFETRNVPSTTNALGIKGAGEAGTIGAAPATMNAIADALYRAYGIDHIDMPATPLRIWSAIQAAKD